jgi:DNA-binding MarR family transcriptional regulator
MDDAATPGLSLLLTQLTKRLFRSSDEDEMGIRLRHFVALALLRSPGGVSQQALGEMLCTDANNLVLLLNELEADGLAVRRRDTDDRRRHIVEITPAGRKALTHAERALAPHESRLTSALSPDERVELERLLILALAGTAPTPTPVLTGAAGS